MSITNDDVNYSLIWCELITNQHCFASFKDVDCKGIIHKLIFIIFIQKYNLVYTDSEKNYRNLLIRKVLSNYDFFHIIAKDIKMVWDFKASLSMYNTI